MALINVKMKAKKQKYIYFEKVNKLVMISDNEPNPNGFHLSTKPRPNIAVARTNAGSKKRKRRETDKRNITTSSVCLGFFHIK